MILISHRGNINGPDPVNENKPEYILNALQTGFEVEVDVWFHENNFYLGHDEPQYEVKSDFLKSSKIWCHAKNIKCLQELLKIGAHCFWHEKDKVTLTSNNFIWTYPGQTLTKNSICVLPEKEPENIKKEIAAGICSDFIGKYKND